MTDGSEVRLTKGRDPTTGFGIVNAKELLLFKYLISEQNARAKSLSLLSSAWVHSSTVQLFYGMFELPESC